MEDPGWAGALTVAAGALCYRGALSGAEQHHHVGVQVIQARDGSFEVSDAHGGRAVTSAAVIPSGHTHGLRITAATDGVLVFLDPGRLVPTDTIPDDATAWAAAGHELPCHTTWLSPIDLVGRLLTAPPTGYRTTGPRHPSVRIAVDLIPRLVPAPIRLTDVARTAGLSPNRLGRLFKEQVGQSFSSYVRWIRLRHAVTSLSSGASLTDAAHAAGFTDSAHANRVCREMFGMAPSTASRGLTWA